jgi:protein involved in ribonucleotide reduction
VIPFAVADFTAARRFEHRLMRFGLIRVGGRFWGMQFVARDVNISREAQMLLLTRFGNASDE